MSPIDVALAALPIALVATLLAFRLKPIPVVLGALAVTLALSFRFPMTTDALASGLDRLVPVLVAVSLIILGGVLLNETLAVAGAQTRIGSWLRAAARDHDRSVLLIGLAIAPLGESLIGWGIGIVIAVPLLIQLGLSATKAATIALLGMVISPWGSLGPGLLVSAGLGGESLRDVGSWAAIFSLPVLLVMGAAVAIVGSGWRAAVRRSGELLAMVAIMWIVLTATNLWVSVPLGGVLSALAGALWLLLCARVGGGRFPRMDGATARSLLPYGVLVTGLLSMTALTSFLPLGAASGVLASPALWLVITAAVTPLLLGLDRATTRVGFGKGMRTFWPLWFVTVLFITFGALLAANGMAAALSDGAAMLGPGFLFVVPLLGFIGGYATTSNTAVASMFSAGVAHVATALDASPIVALGAQNAAVGPAVGASPPRIALAAAMADDNRREGTPTADLRYAALVLLAANGIILAILTPVAVLLAT
ncbi:L-lactate permease [Salinibacterium sp. GXW1014]|uniref:L-lactate permease n=1 Tax=Salinibacterium sp. GXW1014 TaxID=3377838 RepID=UPI00383B23ED